MTARLSSAFRWISHLLVNIEKWTIIFLMSLLVVFSLMQIILRNFFLTGIVWGDDLLRHGVLWISFLGAARATVENKHIRIDLLPRLMPARGSFVLLLISALFSCLLCLVLSWASWNFVQGERLMGDIAFASIPYWWLELIFPFSFGLMALRFAFNLISGLLKGPDRIGE